MRSAKKCLCLLMAWLFSVLCLLRAFSFSACAEEQVIYRSAQSDTMKIAITFDDGPHPSLTPRILKILEEYGIKATFFMVGFWAEDYPEMVKAIDYAGIEIGTHSNTHPDFTKLDESQMRLELETSIQTIKKITSKEVELFRAPYGAYNNAMLNLTEEMNLKTIQ